MERNDSVQVMDYSGIVTKDKFSSKCEREKTEETGDDKVVKTAQSEYIAENSKQTETSKVQNVTEDNVTVDEPEAKKEEHSSENNTQFLITFMEEPYEKQVKMKFEELHTHLKYLDQYLTRLYVKYPFMLNQKQLKYDGMIFELNEMQKCLPNLEQTCMFTFSVGIDEETKQRALGLSSGVGLVRSLPSLKQTFPEHVAKVVQVFEKMVISSGRPPVLPPEQQRLWHKLIIQTNSAKDLMVIVFVHRAGLSSPEELKELNEELKKLFESPEGKECNITTLFVKPVCLRGMADSRYQQNDPIIGPQYIEHSVCGYKLHLPPTKLLWNCENGAEILCQAVKELVEPTDTTSVLEVGCGNGLLGFYLSKFAGEVLGVDLEDSIEGVKMNAARNNVIGCQYYFGDDENLIPDIFGKMKYATISALVITGKICSTPRIQVIKQLRRMTQLKRLVLITEMSASSPLSPILILARPPSEEEKTDPFFPVKIVPVDTLPNSRGYVLLILMERLDHDTVLEEEKKNRGGYRKTAPKNPFEKPKPKRGGRKVKQKLEQRSWMMSGDGNMPGIRGSQNLIRGAFGNRDGRVEPYRDQYFQRTYSDTVDNPMNVVGGHNLREMIIEQNRCIEEIHRRKWLEEMEYRRLLMEEREQMRSIGGGNCSQGLMNSSTEVAAAQLSAENTEKLKQIIADTIKSAGLLDQQDVGMRKEDIGTRKESDFGMDNRKSGPQPLLGLQVDKPSFYQEGGGTYRRDTYTDFGTSFDNRSRSIDRCNRDSSSTLPSASFNLWQDLPPASFTSLKPSSNLSQSYRNRTQQNDLDFGKVQNPSRELYFN